MQAVTVPNDFAAGKPQWLRRDNSCWAITLLLNNFQYSIRMPHAHAGSIKISRFRNVSFIFRQLRQVSIHLKRCAALHQHCSLKRHTQHGFDNVLFQCVYCHCDGVEDAITFQLFLHLQAPRLTRCPILNNITCIK